jgi:hypothetical protein
VAIYDSTFLKLIVMQFLVLSLQLGDSLVLVLLILVEALDHV